jgi:hypothetical protein
MINGSLSEESEGFNLKVIVKNYQLISSGKSF